MPPYGLYAFLQPLYRRQRRKVGNLVFALKIFIVAAKKQADGSLQAPRINYGKDGLTPPM